MNSLAPRTFGAQTILYLHFKWFCWELQLCSLLNVETWLYMMMQITTLICDTNPKPFPVIDNLRQESWSKGTSPDPPSSPPTLNSIDVILKKERRILSIGIHSVPLKGLWWKRGWPDGSFPTLFIHQKHNGVGLKKVSIPRPIPRPDMPWDTFGRTSFICLFICLV